MKTIQTLAEGLTGQPLLDLLTEKMLSENEDFRQVHSNYQTTITKLQEVPSSSTTPTVDDVVAAVNQQATSTLLFSAYLGFLMNLEHFHNPMLPNCTWSHVDYCDYLHANAVRTLPDYKEAQTVLSRFYDSLTPESAQTYGTVAEYLSFWDAAGAKLAHYYGYLLGNEILHRLVPGYHPDAALTLRYRAMLEDYFGMHFLPTDLHRIIG